MLSVQYGTTTVNGQLLTMKETQHKPNIQFPVEKNNLYTILMIDPDSPQPDFIHWLIVNITPDRYDTILSYFPPQPPSGTHHYYFYLCMQQSRIQVSRMERYGFQTREFMKQYGLQIIDRVYGLVKK